MRIRLRDTLSRLLLVGLLAVSLLLTACGGKPAAKSEAPAVKIEVFTAQKGLPNSDITALAVFGGQIWAGTRNGLTRFDGTNWQIHVKKNTNALPSNEIESLSALPDSLLIATENGAARYQSSGFSGLVSGLRVRSIAQNGPTIVLATAHGIEQSTGGPFQPYGKENASLVDDEVNVVAFDRKGRIWAGTRVGMSMFQGAMFQNFSGPAKTIMGSSLVEIPPSPPNCQLIGNNIKCILPWKDRLVIGTTSGMTITDMENSYISYTAPHKEWVQRGAQIVEEPVAGNSPLPDNVINSFALSSDENTLYVGTRRGLGIFHNNAWVDLSGKLSELNGLSISALAIDRTTLWVGTPAGLLRVENIDSVLPTTAK